MHQGDPGDGLGAGEEGEDGVGGHRVTGPDGTHARAALVNRALPVGQDGDDPGYASGGFGGAAENSVEDTGEW